jgi:protein-disulfide isomerase
MSRRRKRSKPSAQTKPGTQSRAGQWWLIGGIAVAALVVVGLVIWLGLQNPPARSKEDIFVNGRSMGKPDAPVTMQAYADFLCSHCRDFALEVEPELVEKYVKSGVLRIEYHYFMLGGERSLLLDEAAECAARQNKFWEYHDKLYTLQGVRLDKGRLTGIAQELGLDMDAFNSCMVDESVKDVVYKDTKEGKAKGVQGTPTFFVNGRRIVGAQPLGTFERAIEEAEKRQ